MATESNRPQYQTVPIKDLGAGIDQLSAENRAPEGYSEEILNMNPKSEGHIARRPGYQMHSGLIPVRIEKVEYTDAATENICFYLDSSVNISSVDLSSIRSTPILVYGRTSSPHAGDFSTTDSVHYYSATFTDARKQFLNGTHVLVADSAGTQPVIWSYATESTSLTNNSNSLFIPDSVDIDKTTYSASLGYTNGTPTFPGFTYFLSKPTSPGLTYNSSLVSFPPGTLTTAITAATHNLSNFNIQVKVFVDTGATYSEVIPDLVSIATNGDVTITATNSSASTYSVFYSLTSSPISSVLNGSVAASSSLTLQIPNCSTDFIALSCYLETSIGGPREQVIPDSISVDSLTQTASVTFTNSSSTGANFFIYYEFGRIASNKVCVSGSVITAPDVYEDLKPQLTLWGLPHSLIYGPNPDSSRPGWVTHVDSYKSAGEGHLVAGLGGNLFSEQTRSAIGTQYSLPLLYPNLRSRVLTSTIVGPTFYDSSDTPTRTRGSIQFVGGGEGTANASSITWDSGNGWVKYSLSCPSLVINGLLGTIFSTTAGLEDVLTIQQAGWSTNNGSFLIKQVSNTSPNQLDIWVDNPNRTDGDLDEQNSGAKAGCFTDQVSLNATSIFLEGDVVNSDLFQEESLIKCSSSLGSILVLNNLTDPISIPAGLRLVAERTGSVIPLRTLNEVPSVDSIVLGDSIGITDELRKFRVKYVNANPNTNVTINSDGETAVVTLGSGDSANFWLGQSILLTQAGSFSGEQVITSIPSSTSLEFSSTEVVTGQTGILFGKTIEVDEQFPNLKDSSNSLISYEVEKRWIPIEAPDDSFGLTPSTHFRYFDTNSYAEQPYLRSVMVQDNMYFTNGSDEVLKYDGTNIYRAGLFRWQPHLFVTTSTTAAAKISINTPTTPFTAISAAAGKFSVALGDESKFSPGDRIFKSDDSSFYTVDKVGNDASNGFVYVLETISGAGTGNLSLTGVFKYYFRLNAVDANNNLIGSAVVGSQDFAIELGASAQVRLKLVGLPAWDLYDYSRLEVQVYRTQRNGVLFYRLSTLPLSFNNGEGYLDYVDTDSDDSLVDADEISVALKGQELGTTFNEPIRAKYLTSIGNRLVLGNLTEYPSLDINFIDQGTRITPAVLNGFRLLFRKDSTDSGTTTDNLNRIAFEFKNTTSGSITNVTTTAAYFEVTTSAAHGLVTGNWVYLLRDSITNDAQTRYMGWFQVASAPTTTTFRIVDLNNWGAFAAGTDVNKFVKATAGADVPVYLGTDGNWSMVNGNRSVLEGYEFQAVRRLAAAINCTQRKTDVGISGQSNYSPFLIANAGGEFGIGQLVIRQPKVLPTILEVLLPTFTGYNIYVNSILRSSGTQVSAIEVLQPSRILASYPNFPEVMDNTSAVLDSNSDSAVDVNSSDGQQVTGLLPFFSDAAFGAALKDGTLVTFKTNSIYLVNLGQKALGLQPLQKLESQGLGCTAPYSIATTKDAIVFANEAGVFRLTRNLMMDYVGRRLERLWQQEVDRSQLSLAQGTNYGIGRQYKLSFPLSGATENSDVFVYDHTREYVNRQSYQAAMGSYDGSWTRYDNHPATGWANLNTEAFFSSTRGEVFKIRTTGLLSDFRDDSSGYTYRLVPRAMDFGDSGIRKVINSVTVHFRDVGDVNSVKAYSAPDLSEDFEELDAFIIRDLSQSEDGLSDSSPQKITSLRFSIDKRKLMFIQLKFEGSAKDEPFEIAAIDFRVGAMNEKGIGQAANSGKA